MTLSEYNKNKEIQTVTRTYIERHGGSFFWEEPGGSFMYELDEISFSPPVDATVEWIIKDIKSGKLLSELWAKTEDSEQDVLY